MFDSHSVTADHPLTATVPRARPVATAAIAARTVAIALLVATALAVRLFELGAVSFGEDEINKLRAVEAYQRGDITANAEHPMLMKLAIWASHRAAQRLDVSPEAAVRFPNAVAGAATTGVIYLLAESLFDPPVAAFAALLWAVDLNAAAINRIAKEDTFLVFFLLLGAYAYEKAKATPPADLPARVRWFMRSAAAFGLMLASKYMPWFFGLHAMYTVASDDNPADRTRDKGWSFFGAMGAAFLLANVAIILPGTWHYMADYARGDTLRHTGYFFGHRDYLNTVDMTPWGLPPWFYATFFATKVPIAVLAAAGAGAAWIVTHAAHRGATFLRVFLVFPLLAYSLVAGKFLRYMLPVLAVVDIAAAVGIVWVLRAAAARLSPRWRVAVASAAILAIGAPAIEELRVVGPYYGLAQNAIGARLTRRGALFPDDEFYDAGAREAVAAIAATASRGAVICSDATAVVSEYLARNGRSDIRSCSIAHDGLPMQPIETWVIAQDSHTYFENAAVLEAIRRRGPPWIDVRVAGVPAAQVYRFR